MEIGSKIAKKEKIFDVNFKRELVLNILSRRDITDFQEKDLETGYSEKERKLLFDVLDKALSSLVSMRKTEGLRLAEDLSKRCSLLYSILEDLQRLASKGPEEIRRKLLRRLETISDEMQVDPARLAMEVALLADKADIAEELVRIESHLNQFEKLLTVDGNGKKLDFLVQELGREFNTIASKSADASISSLIVESKAQLEKIKEQALNLE
jgi:uncharacterized protein (TIGR00255 family)